MLQKTSILTGCLAALLIASTTHAQGRTLARLFWQDDSDAILRWGDLKKNADGYHLTPETVDQFPRLDTDEQSLVQMQHNSGLILLGVHDQADGTFGSGWVAIESGAIEEPHGDHSHWRFHESPSVARKVIDDTQGNPAHVYQYGETFVMANDKKNGFTLTSAELIRQAEATGQAATFVEGGNGHITLAVVNDRVAYATWIAPFGEHAGRVDVIGLGEHSGKRYAIHCPTGGLHGATTNQGKVFLAPSDGVCWVDADLDMNSDPDSVEINHLALGVDADDRPLRTGAFANLGDHVLFTAGKGDRSKLCILNASDIQPSLIEVALDVPEGHSVMSPIPMKTATGSSLACLFVESKEQPETDSLMVIALDPNGDGDFADAVVEASVAVGRNQMSAHAGHHDAVLLPGGRRIAVTNPGDQSIWIMSASDFSVQAKLPVTGAPTRILAIGG